MFYQVLRYGLVQSPLSTVSFYSPFYHIHVANLRYDVDTINANTNCLKAALLCVARNQIEAVHVRPGAAMTSVVYMVHANVTATATCLHSSPSD